MKKMKTSKKKIKMKGSKHLVVFILLIYLAMNMAKAQTYVHFPDSNAVWHETYIFTPPPQIWSLWYNGIGETFYKGDTIINNKKYHRLYQNIRNNFCSRVIEGTGYCAALREDTINRKVYSISYGENDEHMLYNFNLKPGDTLPYSGGAIIDFIDTLVTNDGVRRSRWNVTGEYYSAAVIEGIGGTHGLLSNALLREYPDVTMCFEGDRKQTVYINDFFGYGYGYCEVPTDSCYYLSNQKTFKEEILSYPNPIKTNKTIHIDLSINEIKEINNIYLVNTLGQAFTIFFEYENNAINARVTTAPGIYNLEIITKNHRQINKKIIVTN